MFKNGKKVLLTVLFVSLIFLTAGCGAPKTFEEFVKNDKDSLEQINSVAKASNLDIEIKGNTVIYTYDISQTAGMTEEIAKSEKILDAFNSTLDSLAYQFGDLCAQMEESSKINGISITVKYTYKGSLVVERTFTSDSK